MSRRFTLEDYLEEFVDEETEPAEEDIRLHVTDAQVRSVGMFFIECMGGIFQSLRSENGTPLPLLTLQVEQSNSLTNDVMDEATDESTTDEDDFIN